MKYADRLSGSVRFRIIAADISYALQELTKCDVIIFNVELESELSAFISISSRDWKKANIILNRIGARTEMADQWGLPYLISKLRHRMLLVVSCLILLVLTIWLPTRILFWEIQGNDSVPADYILAQAQQAGLHFGCKRTEIRSEKIKNQLLSSIPDLDWVGVTTSGCVATIRVSESDVLTRNKKTVPMGNIVALCDGVVNSITVTKGIALCKPGQAVKKGQVLISGYEDCGFVLKYSGAEGDVYADTIRVLEGNFLINGTQRNQFRSVYNAFSLRIGKNIINFSKDSGIYDASCVKMYEERYVTLPGGFQLPVCVIRERWFYYETSSCIPEEYSNDWLSDAAQSYLQDLILGGKLQCVNLMLYCENDIGRFCGTYRCTEQIGVNMIGEKLSYGKNS